MLHKVGNFMDINEKAFHKLLGDVIKLYFDDILIQYGLNEQQELDIVSSVTNLPKEYLIELKQTRKSQIEASKANFYNIDYSAYFKNLDGNEPIDLQQ